jgi:hypothetical protein
LPAWISISDDGTKVVLFSEDSTLEGQYVFKVAATIDEYAVLNDDLTFTITFSCMITSIEFGKIPTDFTFFIGDVDPKPLTLPGIGLNPYYCPQDWYEIHLSTSQGVDPANFASI